MSYISGFAPKVRPSSRTDFLAERCNAAAEAICLIENRSVVILTAIDTEAQTWRPLLQAMGLMVFNGFHHEGIGDNPVVIISDSLWRQPAWHRNSEFLRRQSPHSVVCVLGGAANLDPSRLSSTDENLDDARAALVAAGIDYFTVEEPEDDEEF